MKESDAMDTGHRPPWPHVDTSALTTKVCRGSDVHFASGAAMAEHCVCIVLALCWPCVGVVLALRWRCVGDVLALCWHCLALFGIEN